MKKANTGKIWLSTPTEGLVSIEWALNLIGMTQPMNRVLILHAHKGTEVGDARQYIAEIFMKYEDCSHLFFVDDDVIIPSNALISLLRREKDIIGGVYALKNITPPQPLLFSESRGNGIVTEWNPGDVIKVSGIGMGCCLISREVFKKIEPPWFRTDQDTKTTEDIYFCDKATAAGFEIFADTAVECYHQDRKTGTLWPCREGQPVIRPKDPFKDSEQVDGFLK